METAETKTEPPTTSDEDLRQIFRDILKNPEKRAAAFQRLEELESTSNVSYLPGSLRLPKPKEKKRHKKDKSAFSAENLRALLELYKEHKSEIEDALRLGGQAAATVIGLLFARKSAKSE